MDIVETFDTSENFSTTLTHFAVYMAEKAASFSLWSNRYTYAMKAPLANNAPYVEMISAILEGDRITHCGAPSYQSSSGHVISHLARRSSMIAWLVLRGEKNRENPIFLDN